MWDANGVLLSDLMCLLQALVGAVAAVAVLAVLKCMLSVPKSSVYLVDFAVHKGLDEWKFSKDLFIPMSAETGVSDLTCSTYSCNTTPQRDRWGIISCSLDSEKRLQ